MTGLTKRDAMVFALRYFEDFSYEVIAAQTGINVNQVGVILHRARKLLQETVDRHSTVTDSERRRLGKVTASNSSEGDSP